MGTQSQTRDNWGVENIAWNMTVSSVYSSGLDSPDLNPMEHLWDEMERAVRSMNVPLSNLEQLCDAKASAWTNLPVERFRHLVECPKEFRLFCRQRSVRPGTRCVHLINYVDVRHWSHHSATYCSWSDIVITLLGEIAGIHRILVLFLNYNTQNQCE